MIFVYIHAPMSFTTWGDNHAPNQQKSLIVSLGFCSDQAYSFCCRLFFFFFCQLYPRFIYDLIALYIYNIVYNI